MNPSTATFERLRTLLSEILGIDDVIRVQPHAYLRDDLGADSLDAIELQIAIEEEFGIEIPDDALPRIITVGDLVKRIDAAIPTGVED